MRLYLITILTVGWLFSCRTDPADNTNPARNQTPEALQDPEALQNRKMKSSRGFGSNLVDQLYTELMDQTPRLKALDNEISTHIQTRQNLQREFESYNQKSIRYYRSADQALNTIQDSVLKARVQQLIRESERQYHNHTAPVQHLSDVIRLQQNSLQDQYMALKIIKTLLLISTYQHNHLPASQPYKELNQKLDTTLIKIRQEVKE